MTIEIGKNVYIAETAVLIGDVKLSDGVSVFDHAVLRADFNSITVGKNSNIQDNVSIHVAHEHPVIIGENVSVGHNAVVHGATVDDNVVVGMGAILLNGSKVGSGSIVAAGAVVVQGFEGPKDSILAGIPAEVKKTSESIRKSAIRGGEGYQILKDKYIEGSIEKRIGRGKI